MFYSIEKTEIRICNHFLFLVFFPILGGDRIFTSCDLEVEFKKLLTIIVKAMFCLCVGLLVCWYVDVLVCLYVPYRHGNAPKWWKGFNLGSDPVPQTPKGGGGKMGSGWLCRFKKLHTIIIL